MSDRPDTNWGDPAKLPERIAYWVGRVKYDKSVPWVGMGLLTDLEAVVRLLSLVEFADWLRTHPDPDLQRWADAVREASEQRQALADAIEANLPQSDGPTYEHDVEAAGKFMAEVRGVLVECNALAADDTQTDVPALLRALLA